MIDEKAIVNAIVALLATGGSTNHTLHLVAIAKAAGIVIDWDDFDELSQWCRCSPHLPERRGRREPLPRRRRHRLRDPRTAGRRPAARRRHHHPRPGPAPALRRADAGHRRREGRGITWQDARPIGDEGAAHRGQPFSPMAA
jgi:hypothetical protein